MESLELILFLLGGKQYAKFKLCRTVESGTPRNPYAGNINILNAEIEALIRVARSEGEMSQEIAILKAIKDGFKANKVSKGASAEFFRLNERKLEALIESVNNDMQKAETAVLRMANDQYRKIIYNAQIYANTGAGTYEKAVDMATKDFLAAGLNCVEYANGARHTLKDYADMAIRTASKRAYLQGEGTKRQEWGISTVIVNKRGNPCPKCLPFCGKVLIDDVWSGGSKKDGNYPLMSYAVKCGLYHPRCKDAHTTYFPGISAADDTWTEKELEDIGLKAKEEAKQQYAKRLADKFDRMAKNSLDKDNKRMYQSRAEQWENVATDGSKENLQQEVKITKKDKKNVNRDLVNSKEYHDRYEAIGMPKKGFESAYVEAKKILEKADGDDYEFLTVIDTKTGKTVATTLEYKKVHRDKVGFNESDYNKAYSYRGSITQIHNHSKNGRPSGADIISCFKHENVEYSIIACHDGDLFVLQDFNRKFDVEKIYDEYYNEAVREMQNLTDDEPIPTDISDAKKKACKIRATTKLYELNKTKKMFKITRYSNE